MVRIKLKEKQKAVELRKEGLSYSEILKEISVAKSTLSLWLREVGLSNRQKQRLTQKKLAAIKRAGEKSHKLRMERWNDIKKKASQEVGSLSNREGWLLGVALYWAEGAKEKEIGSATNIKFSNSDELMILFFREWLNKFLKVSYDQMLFELYIHETADWELARKFWASKLQVWPQKIRVYFKKNKIRTKRKNVGDKYHGLIRICVNGSSSLVRKISGWTDGICKNYKII